MPADEMDDRQRRAMFARMKGGGGGGRGGGSGGQWTQSSSGGWIPPPDADGKYRTTLPDGTQLTSDTHEGLFQQMALHADAQGIQHADADFLLAGLPGAGGLLSRLGKFGKALASWQTPLLAALTSGGIGEFRQSHPTMDPRMDKALAIGQQIAAYVAAISGLSTGKQTLGGPLMASKLGQLASAGLKGAGEWMSNLGKAAASYLPEGVKGPLSALYKGYTKAADYTGASISDVMSATQAPAKFNAARKLEQAAQDAFGQASAIEKAAGSKGEVLSKQAYGDLMSSHKASLAGDPAAREAYLKAAGDFWDTKRGVDASTRSADSLRKYGDSLNEQAKGLRTEAATSTIKAGLVTAGFVAKEAHEESTIRGIQRDMEAAFAQGENYTVPAEKPRGALGTALAAAIGTLGNPIEKQTRYGQTSAAAQTAYHRAQYDMIGRAEKSGEFSRAEADSARSQLAEDKPWNMAGKGAWTFAPASAAFLSWQAGNVADHFNQQVEVGKVKKVLDGDTIELASGKIVRMMGVDTPESVHPNKPVEYLGPEASAFQKANLTGKTVRLVTSPGAEVDKYGRNLAYVETLPGPLGAAFKIPVVGKYIPGADQNKRMIELGYGQPRYLELSGGHQRQVEYDKALVRARRQGVGVHSPEGLEKLDYHYQTPAERRGAVAPAPSSAGPLLGAGLMVTGQSGAFRQMGGAGNVAAQTWNAVLAGLGAAEYNARAAARPGDLVFRPPKTTRTVYEKKTDSVLEKRRTRRKK